MGAVVVFVALVAPAVGALVSLGARRAPWLEPGLVVTRACAVAALLAVGLVVESGRRADGLVGDPAWWQIDRASALLLAVVAATAAVVAEFSRRSLDDDGRRGRYFTSLGMVVTGSALVVVPGSGVALVAGWLVSTWALVALVGYAAGWRPARLAQVRIVRTLAIGDAALVLAVAVTTAVVGGVPGADLAGTADELARRNLLGVSALDLVAVLLVVAGLSRSAIFPFHRWLIGTVNAPAPVSAVVHAGFVSGAGILAFRFAPVVVRSDVAVVTAFVLAVFTVVVASAAGALRSDVKGALAWSTVAQMAFMVVQVAVGAFSSAVFHIAGHGMYKAAQFLGAGDTVSAGLRARRRPRPERTLTKRVRWAVVLPVTTGSVAAAMWVIPPDVNAAGRVLIAIFAAASIAAALHGWLRSGPLAPVGTVLSGVALAVVAAFGYVGALRLVEAFVKPSVEAVSGSTIIGPWTVALTVTGITVLVGAMGAAARFGGRPDVEAAAQRIVAKLASPSAPTAPTSTWTATPATADAGRRARIRAAVDQASDVAAPLWPLASFVAVNPLGRLETLGFDDATEHARRWLRARTHLSLDEFRRDHEAGLTTRTDLEYAALDRFLELGAREPLTIDGRTVDPLDVVVADLLHGPDAEPVEMPRTALERRARDDLADRVDAAASRVLTAYVAPSAWPLIRRGESVVAAARRLAMGDPSIGSLIDPGAAAWLHELDDDPAAVIAAALAVCGVDDDRGADELRGHIARLPGWTGLSRWRNEWAPSDEPLVGLAPIEVVAVRALFEALVVGSQPSHEVSAPPSDDTSDELLAARVAAVAEMLAPHGEPAGHEAIASVLVDVPAESRASVWLAAQEHHLHAGLLDELARPEPASTGRRPDAQVVFCIDVRSEGLRGHLEATGAVETLGFAGFFGVPMAIRKLGWDHAEARCPVLVSPSVTAHEHVLGDRVGEAATALTRGRAVTGVASAHGAAKRSPGTPFVLAETLGWILGPQAAARTFRPGRSAAPPASTTRMAFDDDEALVEQRVFLAESVLNAMGLIDRFAPLVVLCGHTSVTTNNPHATALECGACAGAAGDDNARAVAALLNSADVRAGLVERGITIPDDTWFAAALHDTASDRVSILDAVLAPDETAGRLAALQAQLDEAGGHQAARRAVALPGPVAQVRDRGADWAQVRPEWGLARNAAFVIGPRSLTAGLDLGGRAFLHSYDSADDPTGRVLETIMTAPLIVGHWISSQYYFSTVDPESFGAGDKLLHNPIGVTGVVSGDGGDIRVGLPLQSTHVDGRRHHQPVRLLAAVQADLGRIEEIIANNPILQTLTAGSWLRIAGRSDFGEPWSIRTGDGTWITSHRGFDIPESFAGFDTLGVTS